MASPPYTPPDGYQDAVVIPRKDYEALIRDNEALGEEVTHYRKTNPEMVKYLLWIQGLKEELEKLKTCGLDYAVEQACGKCLKCLRTIGEIEAQGNNDRTMEITSLKEELSGLKHKMEVEIDGDSFTIGYSRGFDAAKEEAINRITAMESK